MKEIRKRKRKGSEWIAKEDSSRNESGWKEEGRGNRILLTFLYTQRIHLWLKLTIIGEEWRR